MSSASGNLRPQKNVESVSNGLGSSASGSADFPLGAALLPPIVKQGAGKASVWNGVSAMASMKS